MGQLTRYYLKELCKNPESFWQFIDNNPYLERSDIQLDRIKIIIRVNVLNLFDLNTLL